MSVTALEKELQDANERFYQAFEGLKIEAMEALWSRDAAVSCVHPGWKMMRGWERVRASWEQIFSGTPFIQFIITDVSVGIAGDCGWVSCVENIVTVPGDAPSYATVHATNLFRREGGEWRLVVHHASGFAAGA